MTAYACGRRPLVARDGDKPARLVIGALDFLLKRVLCVGMLIVVSLIACELDPRDVPCVAEEVVDFLGVLHLPSVVVPPKQVEGFCPVSHPDGVTATLLSGLGGCFDRKQSGSPWSTVFEPLDAFFGRREFYAGFCEEGGRIAPGVLGFDEESEGTIHGRRGGCHDDKTIDVAPDDGLEG